MSWNLNDTKNKSKMLGTISKAKHKDVGNSTDSAVHMVVKRFCIHTETCSHALYDSETCEHEFLSANSPLHEIVVSQERN